MRIVIALSIVAVFFAPALFCTAQEMPEMPGPVEQHAWLQQLAGQWDAICEITVQPGEPPVKSEGTEDARMIGELWLLAENNGNYMGTHVTGILTVGYNPEIKKYIGTWIDSASSYMWKYEGTVDKTGKTLTLETEGPSPTNPGTTAKFRESIEIKSPDHKVFTSRMQQEDGTWDTMVTVSYRRKE